MNAKTKALKTKSGTKVDMGYTDSRGIRHLSSKEQASKTKSWPKHKGSTVAWPTTRKHKREHQATFGQAWNE